MPNTIEKPKTDDYKIADISLADFGRKEIDIAEHEMPGLMQARPGGDNAGGGVVGGFVQGDSDLPFALAQNRLQL